MSAVLPAGEDPTELTRAGAIGNLWAADWSNPREDIYGPDDGQPEHDPGNGKKATSRVH